MTLSDHLKRGKIRSAHAAVSIVSMGLLTVFLHVWLWPEIDAPRYFYALSGAAFVGLLLTSAVPRVGSKATEHDIYSGIATIPMAGITLGVYLDQQAHSLVRILAIVTTIYAVFIAAKLLTLSMKNYLVYQFIGYGMFHVTLLTLTYV